MIYQNGIEALIAQVVGAGRAPLDDLSSASERRTEARWPVFDQRASLCYHGREYRVAIQDISHSGMRIAHAPDVLTVGAKVQIITLLGMRDTLAMAWEVIHLFEADGVRYAGLQFTPHHPDSPSRNGPARSEKTTRP